MRGRKRVNLEERKGTEEQEVGEEGENHNQDILCGKKSILNKINNDNKRKQSKYK